MTALDDRLALGQALTPFANTAAPKADDLAHQVDEMCAHVSSCTAHLAIAHANYLARTGATAAGAGMQHPSTVTCSTPTTCREASC